MKFKSAIVTIGANSRRQYEQAPNSTSGISRGRLDTVFNGLLLATGIALNVAAAAEAAWETRPAGTGREHIAAQRGGEIGRIAERFTPSSSVRQLQPVSRSKS